MEVSGRPRAPTDLPPSGEGAPGAHWVGEGVDPEAGLGAVVGKKFPGPCRE